jgi:hypothetical protein
MERVSGDNSHYKQLLTNLYKCSAQSFAAPTDFKAGDDPYQALQRQVRLYHSNVTNFQVLESHGYIDNAAAHYNFSLEVGNKYNNARKLAAELNGRVDMQTVFSPTGHHQLAPIVVVEVSDKSTADALARQYRGRVKMLVNSPSDVRCIVVIDVAA